MMVSKLYDIMRYFFHEKFMARLIFEYWQIIGKFKKEKLTVLEIGIRQGHSLRYWDHYFKHSGTKIIGIDLTIPAGKFPKKVTMLQCDQNDSSGLKNIAEKYGPFNIIIDDGAHFKKETENSFNVLWKHVVPGGYYFIEDWALMGDDQILKNISKKKHTLKIADERVIFQEPRHLIQWYFLYVTIPGKSIAFYQKQF